jgi:hypothetical protein
LNLISFILFGVGEKSLAPFLLSNINAHSQFEKLNRIAAQFIDIN